MFTVENALTHLLDNFIVFYNSVILYFLEVLGLWGPAEISPLCLFG